MNEAALKSVLLLSYQYYDIPAQALTAYLCGRKYSLSEHVAIQYLVWCRTALLLQIQFQVIYSVSGDKSPHTGEILLSLKEDIFEELKILEKTQNTLHLKMNFKNLERLI